MASTAMNLRRAPQAFSLIELLVSMAILIALMAIILKATDQFTRVFKASSAEVDSYQSARVAFDTITRRLRQATLNTYWDYFDAAGKSRPKTGSTASFIPAKYGRQSDLHFISGPAGGSSGLIPDNDTSISPTNAIFFQAPLGYTQDTGNYGDLGSLLTACGYYVEFGRDTALPSFLSSLVSSNRYRYRLKQFLQPAEQNGIYETSYVEGTPGTYNLWFQNPLRESSPPVQILADNIIALVFLPMLPKEEDIGAALAPDYGYDSRTGRSFTTIPPDGGAGASGSTKNQLPPLVRVAMVVIDEAYAARRNPSGNTTPPNFVDSAWFKDATKLDADLQLLTDRLNQEKQITYRVFNTSVSMRNAKWSNE